MSGARRADPSWLADALPCTPLVRARATSESIGCPVYAKLEAANPTGSIKDRVARAILQAEFSAGTLASGDRVIESSSGNMVIALAALAKPAGISVTAVVPADVDAETSGRLELLGATVVPIVPRPGETDLAARLCHVERAVVSDDLKWLNQYAHPAALAAHSEGTFAEIMGQLGGAPGTLVIPVSTCATALGARLCAQQHGWLTDIVLVDVDGSALFGGTVGARSVPGLGAGIVTPFSRRLADEEVVRIGTRDAWGAARRVAATDGLLVGGSAGAAFAALELYVRERGATVRSPVVVVCPDGAWRYLTQLTADGGSGAKG